MKCTCYNSIEARSREKSDFEVLMHYKIGVISQSQEFIQLICSCFDETMEPIVSQGFYQQATDVAKEMVEKGANVIIARENTADIIEAAVPIDVVHCDFTAIDSLIAINKASQEDFPIAFVNAASRSRQPYAMLQLAERICGQKVEILTYSDLQSLDDVLQDAAVKGIKCIIGGGAGARRAQQFGIKTIEVLTNYESAKSAVEKASLILKTYQFKIDQDACVLSALNAMDQMYIITDPQGEVLHISSKAEAITGLAPGNNIDEFYVDPGFKRKLQRVKNGETLLNQNHKTPSTSIPLLFSLFPITGSTGTTYAIMIRLDRSDQQNNINTQGKKQKDNLVSRYSFESIIGGSPAMYRTKMLAREYAKYKMNVLITGETGTGKELFAHSIHGASDRAAGPFVAVNCASIPANLLESELFGYEDGAFTGARRGGKIGLFELANGGTFFMDEVGELPPDIQARLLRVIQSREIMRLGGKRQIPIDVRIISATNRNLEQDAKEGTFRSDLFYRLSTLTLEIPSLKDRTEDIPSLAASMISRVDLPEARKEAAISYINDTISQKKGYDWPGNVRELENLVQRCIVEYSLVEQNLITPSESKRPAALENDIHKAGGANVASGSLQEQEIEEIRRVGRQVDWNRQEMSRILGISSSTLWRKMKRFNINPN